MNSNLDESESHRRMSDDGRLMPALEGGHLRVAVQSTSCSPHCDARVEHQATSRKTGDSIGPLSRAFELVYSRHIAA